MRKIISIITLLALSASIFTGCMKEVVNEESAFEAQYIRTDGYIDAREYPIATLITSLDELTGYIEFYKDDYYLNEQPGESGSFIDAVAKYDGEYFKAHVLVLALLEEPSGSIRHKVAGIDIKEDAITVSIERIVPEVGTADMAEWHILIELPEDGISSQEVKISLAE